ncbi:MAG: CsbD family protein [Pseudomonadota bacterium]
MNWDQAKGNWKEIKGKIKEQWGELTNDDLDIINGRRDQLLGSIQKNYGITIEEAERQIKEFEMHH